MKKGKGKEERKVKRTMFDVLVSSSNNDDGSNASSIHWQDYTSFSYFSHEEPDLRRNFTPLDSDEDVKPNLKPPPVHWREILVTIPEVLMRVKKMLGEHRDLLEGFNMFLPTGLELSLLETMDFVKKIKARYEQYPYVYEKFLRFLEQYESGMMTRQEVYKEVNVMFWGTDLITEFGEFFPEIQSKFPQQKS